MSFRDLAHNPDVIRALRKLRDIGIYVSLYPVRKNYGIMAFDIYETTKRLLHDAAKGHIANYVRPDLEDRKDVMVAVIEVPEYEAMPTPAEERDRASKELTDALLRKGIKSMIEIESDTRAYVAIDVDSVAEYVARQTERALGKNVKHFTFYDRENRVLQTHVWTGTTPSEVIELKRKVKAR